MTLTTTKAQFRRNIRNSTKVIKEVDPNKPLSIAQLRKLYEDPGRILTALEDIKERLQNHGHPRLLSRSRKLKEDYLAAQTALALACQNPAYARQLLKIRLQDSMR